MAFSDLANGIGLLYVVDPNDTSKIVFSIPNDDQGARSIMGLGQQSANIGANIAAYGTIRVTSVTGSGSVTNISVNGVNQITKGGSISFTGATSTSALATLIAAAINDDVPSSGLNYTSYAIGQMVYVVAPASAGSIPNGYTLTITITANATATVNDIANGTAAYTNSWNSNFGYRFFIDANSSAVEDVVAGTATEISDFVINKGLNSGIPISSYAISSGSITITRPSSIQYILVDTEGAVATDDLDYIFPNNNASGDIIMVIGVNAGRVVKLSNSGNIVTQGGVPFSTGSYADVITLALSGTSWYEVSSSQSRVPTASQFRTASFPLLSTSGYGSAALTVADNTVVTALISNTNKQKIVVTGSVSLATGNYEIPISTTNAIAGDTFEIEYNAQVTVGSYAVIIGGVTLTAADALSGGIVVMAYYSGSVWQYTMYKNYNDGAKVQTADIATSAVTVAKLENNLKYEMIVVPVSFTNPAENRIRWAYPGTVVGLTAYSTSLIGDDSTITPKNNSGTIMGSGTLTFSNGDPVNTGITSTPNTNNTFVEGDYFSLLTQTSTLGSGTALVTVKILRA